jgi:hypothetical protein
VGQLNKAGLKSLALSVLARSRSVPSRVPDGVTLADPLLKQSVGGVRNGAICWHCGGAGECECVMCGLLKPSVTWAAGECRVCNPSRSQIQ